VCRKFFSGLISIFAFDILLGRGMWHVWGREEVHTEFSLENLTERDYVTDVGVGAKMILKLIFEKYNKNYGLD
jgi:hypothetical protein